MKKPDADFKAFAVELCREHSRDIMNALPFIDVIPPKPADVIEEIFTEGHQPRLGHRPDPKGEM